MAPPGTSALYRLVYRSTAMGVLSGADLDRILLRAKASNAGAGITGMMLFSEGTFLQALEGPPAGVLSLMEKIRRDRRHSSLTIIESELTTARIFPGWPMGYVAARNLTGAQKDALTHLMSAANTRQSLKSAGEPSAVTEQLWAFLGAFREAEAA